MYNGFYPFSRCIDKCRRIYPYNFICIAVVITTFDSVSFIIEKKCIYVYNRVSTISPPFHTYREMSQYMYIYPFNVIRMYCCVFQWL